MALAGSESIRVATNRIQLLARQQPFRFVAYEPTSQHADESADHADYYAPASSMATMPGAATANSPTAAVCPRWRTGPRIQADSAGNPPRQSNTTCSGYLSQVHTPIGAIDSQSTETLLFPGSTRKILNGIRPRSARRACRLECTLRPSSSAGATTLGTVTSPNHLLVQGPSSTCSEAHRVTNQPRRTEQGDLSHGSR